MNDYENQYLPKDRRGLDYDEGESTKLKELNHALFETVSSIQFCIDGAIGLPVSSTATRVTARLLSSDRTQIGDATSPNFCDPDSDVLNPQFDLQMIWKGAILKPTLTVVCRIDTLEKPYLASRCVGFSVLKVFMDVNGQQPQHDYLPYNVHFSSPSRNGGNANLSGGTSSQTYLNAGEFLLPIVYGKIPSEGRFCESVVDDLPHIPDAYLIVRLFDPTNPILESNNFRLLSRGSGAGNLNENYVPQRVVMNPRGGGVPNGGNARGGGPERTFYFEKTSVVYQLCCTVNFIFKKYHQLTHGHQPHSQAPQSKQNVPQPLQSIMQSLTTHPLHDSLIHDILAGVTYNYENDKKLIMKKITDWIIQIFPLLNTKIQFIDSRYFFYYHSKVGINIVLEMLYNMPIRKTIVQRAIEELEENGPTLFQSIQKSLQQHQANNYSITSSGKVINKGSVMGNFPKTSSLFRLFTSPSSSSHPYLPNSINTLYDNQIKYYKSFFRYLPGYAAPSGAPHLGRDQDHFADSIIDDASIEIDMSSREYFPIFNDDFSRTNGIDLSPHACVLIVVIAVDILTNTVLGLGDPTRNNNYNDKNGRNGQPDTSPNSANPRGRKQEDDKRFKLKGLIGTYFGQEFEDDNVVWWGIVPLLSESPFDENRKTRQNQNLNNRNSQQQPTPNFYMPSPMNNGMNYNDYDDPYASNNNGYYSNYNNKEVMASPGRINNQPPRLQMQQVQLQRRASNSVVPFNPNEFNEDDDGEVTYRERYDQYENSSQQIMKKKKKPQPQQQSRNPEADFFERNYAASPQRGGGNSDMLFSPGRSNPVPTPVQNNAVNPNDPINSVADAIGYYFVNVGLHQVPLFNGSPPMDMIHSPNPMAWLLSHIADEVRAGVSSMPTNMSSSPKASNKNGWSAFAKWFSSMNSSSASLNSSIPKEILKRQKMKLQAKQSAGEGNLSLSPGASAIVNIVDPRLKRFGANSISYDLLHHYQEKQYQKPGSRTKSAPHTPIDAIYTEDANIVNNFNNPLPHNDGKIVIRDDLLKRIIKAKTMTYQSNLKTFTDNKKLRQQLEELFSFDVSTMITNPYIDNTLNQELTKQLKKVGQKIRSYQDALPHSIHQKTLIEEINQQFIGVISDSATESSVDGNSQKLGKSRSHDK
eukprot:CAMPEP_0173147286 /NCGR_PEP_ID=MMETSP1105-20130129/9048_1 /TAXON_ID=2985 /ORGANISM="Ochromonas sp., Strain BG-1" /LENGTH=1146 /DNA_ID=CAMNT_0014061749 /DNA_START=56 /DNA_END=3496 /DNA_ORIENTATION=+